MTETVERLKNQASALSIPELAYFLLSSLEPKEEGVEEAWRAEIARRVAEIRSGHVVTCSHAHMVRRTAQCQGVPDRANGPEGQKASGPQGQRTTSRQCQGVPDSANGSDLAESHSRPTT